MGRLMSHADDYNDGICESILAAELGCYEGEETPDAILRLLDDCLDIEVHVVYSAQSGYGRQHRVEILRSLGGPTTRIELDPGEPGYVTVRTWWGSDRAVRTILAPGLFAVADEAAGYVLDAARPGVRDE